MGTDRNTRFGRGLGRMAVKIRDAAWMLGMSQRKLGALARMGEVPSYKQGASRYFRIDALSEWQRQQEEQQMRRFRTGNRRFALEIGG